MNELLGKIHFWGSFICMNIVFMPIDYDTGLKATADSPIPVLEAFVSGSQPTEEWSAHSQEVSRLPWSLHQPFYVPKKGESGESEEEPSAPGVPPAPGAPASGAAPAPTPRPSR
jgi:hypothetical protein